MKEQFIVVEPWNSSEVSGRHFSTRREAEEAAERAHGTNWAGFVEIVSFQSEIGEIGEEETGEKRMNECYA